MLMKWEDLEPGDILRFTKEACECYKVGAPEWYRVSHNVDLRIGAVEIIEENNDSKIKISFSNYTFYSFLIIDRNGFCWRSSFPIFKVVGLAD